jgi:serine palmitoyltransferase
MHERHQQYKPLSRKGKFSHDYVEPLGSWWGKNERIIMGQCLSSIHIQETDTSTLEVVNGASHNYAGFYELTVKAEELHHRCLDRLPMTGPGAVPLLTDVHDTDIATFLHSDFSCSVGTGYGANYLALPALVDRPTMVVLDENSHNSMFTGAYLAEADSIRKFAHNNCNSLEKILQQSVGKFDQIIVAIEGLYRCVA